MNRLIDHLLLVGQDAIAAHIPGFNENLLQQAQESVVVIGDSVSNYFYEGNEQEDWELDRDFPNIAPPFDLCFLDFKAPAFVNSSVVGHHAWVKGMPIAWGLLCKGKEQGKPPWDLSQESQRQLIKASYQHSIAKLQRECLQFGYNENTLPEEERRFTAEQQSSLLLLKAAQSEYKRLQAGEWQEIEQIVNSRKGYYRGAKWVLEISLVLEYSFEQQRKGRVGVVPAWEWEIAVDAQGKVIGTGDAIQVRSGPLAPDYFLDSQGSDVDLKLTMEQRAGAYYQFLCTGLLTFSFLHCKNVSLQTVEEEPEKVKPPQRSKKRKQKRLKQTAVSALPPAPPARPKITYHVLDVEPMKKVLRAEGQSEQQGLKRALHICRGHFANYEEGKGLFGKYHGTYWIPQHVRGSAEQGVRLKDYRVKDVDQGPV